MKLFSGSSNQDLAAKISDHSEIEMGKVDLGMHPNDEFKIRVDDTSSQAALLQSFSIPVSDHILEYLLVADALSRGGAKEITGVIPWFGYSKQDKVFKLGEPLSAKVIAKLIQSGKTSQIITIDLHNPSITGYFDIPVLNLSALPLFIDLIQNNNDLSQTIAISPDAGSVKSTSAAADAIGIPIAYMNKKRDLNTGEVTIKDIDRPVDNLNAIIFDDMIATGSTIIKTAEFLKTKRVNSVTVCATHHLFIPGVQEKLDQAPIDSLVVTDTITNPSEVSSSMLTTLSVAPLLANVLNR